MLLVVYVERQLNPSRCERRVDRVFVTFQFFANSRSRSNNNGASEPSLHQIQGGQGPATAHQRSTRQVSAFVCCCLTSCLCFAPFLCCRTSFCVNSVVKRPWRYFLMLQQRQTSSNRSDTWRNINVVPADEDDTLGSTIGHHLGYHLGCFYGVLGKLELQVCYFDHFLLAL
jgi:hypothetical protein